MSAGGRSARSRAARVAAATGTEPSSRAASVSAGRATESSTASRCRRANFGSTYCSGLVSIDRAAPTLPDMIICVAGAGGTLSRPWAAQRSRMPCGRSCASCAAAGGTGSSGEYIRR
ncbi:hypothetical protein [Streptomyces sp. NRRL B-24085]|uniref:hypothetical protein n=1 Tax=Streptomyces sp. NRRL B-24085 TaxID=1709476 RepID=UPI0006B326AB|nr:hypothetical protein [Streptomyces sp. NRRL B-24085]